jgi:hypothetical protein
MRRRWRYDFQHVQASRWLSTDFYLNGILVDRSRFDIRVAPYIKCLHGTDQNTFFDLIEVAASDVEWTPGHVYSG